MSNLTNMFLCGNQLAGLESTKPVQHQDIINFVDNELTRLNKHNPGYAIKIEKLYSINDMPDTLKEKVLEKYRYFNVEDDWYACLYEYWVEQLKIYGFNEVKINFSGFWSQGDGASFTAEVDLETYLKAHKLCNKYRAALLSAKDGMVKIKVYRICQRYSHEYTISIQNDYSGNSAKVEAQISELAEQILNKARELSREIYRNLESDYNYLTSDESILETLEANDYLFKHNGEIFG